MFTRDQLVLFETLQGCAQRQRVKVYVVGGVLRDIFSGENAAGKDIDFVVEGNALDFASVAAAELGGEVRKFQDFLTAKVVRPARLQTISEIDFASARSESYSQPGALPKVTLAGINEDLKRRDFTINSMAIALSGLTGWIGSGDGRLDTLYKEVIDPFGGRQDLNRRAVRALHPRSFLDDPTRIFRAGRYAARINGKLEAETEELILAAVGGGALGTVSSERKLNELRRIFAEIRPEKSIRLLARLGVFNHLVLYDPGQEEELFALLKKLSDLDARRKDDFTFELGLRVFYHLCDPRQAEERFLALGFGRKHVRRIRKDLEESCEVAVLSELSNEALVLSLLWDSNKNRFSELAKEGRRRGLIVCLG